MPKISTADCVAAIESRYPNVGPWKRRQKYRYTAFHRVLFGENAKESPSDKGYFGYLREFTSTSLPNVTAFVWDSESSEIILVKFLEPKNNARSILEEHLNGEHSGTSTLKERGAHVPEVHTPLIRHNPDIFDLSAKIEKKKDEELTSRDFEPQDFENWEIKSSDDTTVEVWHGGDWQTPMTVTYRYMSDGNFYFDPTSIVVDSK